MENTKGQSVFTDALQFAARAHCGMLRKGSLTPFVTHPMEAAVIAAEYTSDPELLAAAVLHDTVEDTDVTLEQIEELFGARVAALVDLLTEEDVPGSAPGRVWRERKERAIGRVEAADSDVKLLTVADKLSNMRSMVRQYKECSDQLWEVFYEKDKGQHGWYYRSMLEATRQLSHTRAWQELKQLTDLLFGENI